MVRPHRDLTTVSHRNLVVVLFFDAGFAGATEECGHVLLACFDPVAEEWDRWELADVWRFAAD